MAWAILLLVVNTQAWWAMFRLCATEHDRGPLCNSLIVLLEAIMLYLLAAIVLPNIPDEGQVDLRSNYFRHAGWFFGSLVALLLDSLLKSVVVSGGLPGKPDLGFHLFWITTALIAAFTRNERYHKAFVCLSFALFIAYIALLFPWLR